MDDRAKALYKEAYKATEACNMLLLKLAEGTAKCEPGLCSLEDRADAAYAVHQASEMLDELRKKCDALHDHFAKLVGMGWIAKQMQDLTDDPIRTEYVTATPDVKSGATQPSPKKDYNNYRLFMADLGVPEHLVCEHDPKTGEVLRRQVVTVDWIGLTEYLTQLAAEGKPMPRGVDPTKKYPVYALRYRRRKGILEE